MNPSGLCLHLCSCQHPEHSVCQHIYDTPTCKSLKVQWVQTPLLASEWIFECPRAEYQEGKLLYH